MLAHGDGSQDELRREGLQSILQTCRADLDLVRRHSCDEPERPPPSGWIEDRLSRLVDRLEQATGLLESIRGGPESRFTRENADLLAREADHRINNSLQTVITLLDRQAGHADQPAVRDALHLAGSRIEAVARVHAMLHRANGRYGVVPEIELDAYLRGLCERLVEATAVDARRNHLQVTLEPLQVPAATAQHLGLIVTELVSNARRHGLRPNQDKTVWVSGARRGDGSYQLCVEDDGTGLPADFDLRHRPRGLGLRVVSMLADQARARLTADGRPGARFTLTLPPRPG